MREEVEEILKHSYGAMLPFFSNNICFIRVVRNQLFNHITTCKKKNGEEQQFFFLNNEVSCCLTKTRNDNTGPQSNLQFMNYYDVTIIFVPDRASRAGPMSLIRKYTMVVLNTGFNGDALYLLTKNQTHCQRRVYPQALKAEGYRIVMNKRDRWDYRRPLFT